MRGTPDNAVRALPQYVRDLLGSPPRRGEGLNLWFYRAARVLHRYRSDAEIISLLRAATEGAPVQHGEIERAVERSRATAGRPGEPTALTRVPTWPQVNAEQREAIAANGLDLVGAWEMSPLRFESNASHSEEVIDVIFPGNPLLCVGRSNADFATKPRDEWRGQLDKMQFIVPSPMTAQTGHTQGGKVSEHCLENTGPRRFLVIEQDSGTIDEQAAVLFHLAGRAPLALVVHSGSKSLHGWFYCRSQTEARLHNFMRYAVSLGADSMMWTRSQFARMPDGRRDNGKRQTVYFLNPEVLK